MSARCDVFVEVSDGTRKGPFSVTVDLTPDWHIRPTEPLVWTNDTGRRQTVERVILSMPDGEWWITAKAVVDRGARATFHDVSIELVADAPSLDGLRWSYLNGHLDTDEFVRQAEAL